MKIPSPAPEHPRNLAILRIAVLGILLVSPETYSAQHWASLPAALQTPPEGLRWAAQAIPITPAVARVAQACLVLGAVSGLVGLYTRASLAVVTISGLYVFGLSQLTGAVTHDMHLLWFAALLASGPSGAALSVDRWLARRRGEPDPAPSLSVAVPMTAVRALLGLVYFFPGFWKLNASGLDWIFSDNLRNQMYFKWYQHGALPPLRLDQWGTLLRAGALGVVLLEVSFPVLVLFPRTRIVAAVGGLAFHVFSQVFLFIPFMSLWGCYVALFDWGRLGRQSPEDAFEQRENPPERRMPLGSTLLGVALALAVGVQGFRNAVQAWPFACYPTFQSVAGSTMPDLVLEALYADGSHRVLPDGPGGRGTRTQTEWGMVWRVAGLYGDKPSRERLAAYWRRAYAKPAVRQAARGAVAIRFHRAWYSVVPEDWGQAPVRAQLIGEIALSTSGS